ncbi:S9 family peptidase [Aliiglaciecola sp. M165]|uniref:S9 family peptidase n=1 Tax=Aliiglaciecola sp. M165 TaxID=2593649 RepID=UPI0021B0CECA|nr:S9 family peptidase [Aliiglaciecola sp. M165]
MRNILISAATLLVFISIGLPSFAQQDWPYPEDAPTPQPVDIGTASDRPIDISRFLLARGARGGSINQQGTHIAFSSNATGISQLWVMSVKGGQASQLTFGNGITFFRWHPDGKTILYGADNNGDEREAYYLISTDGLKETLAMPSSKAYRAFGAFHQDGNRFSYASTQRNGRDFDLYVYDIKKRQSQMVFQAEFGFFPRAWRPNSEQMLVTETVGEDGENLFLLDTRTQQLSALFKPTPSAAFRDFHWKKDGSGFYFISNDQTEMLSLRYYDVASKRTDVIVKTDAELDNVELCKNGNQLLYSINDNGFETLFSTPTTSFSPKQIDLPSGTLNFSCSDADKAVVTHLGPDSPGTVLSIDLNKHKATVVRKPDMAGISPNVLLSPEVVTFPAQDGVQLQGLLYLPKNSEAKPPIVIDIHGGPTAQSRPAWQPLTQYLLGKGIAVLDINVRGSTGFGKTYARLDNQEKRLDSVRDLVDALAWLKQDGRVNADKAAAMGGSYGGYMVNAVMGAYPDAFVAGASFVGVADWVRALQTASPGLKASDRIEYGDITDPKWQEFYAVNSPINTVDKIVSPMFFQHGVNDPRDPVTESDTMVQALRDRNIPVTYLRLQDEGHSVRKLTNRVMFYRQLADFLETHLKNDK